MGGQEVGYADRAHQAALARLDQGSPRFDIKALCGIGPMDQVEIVVVELRAVERFLNGRDRLVEAMVPTRQL
jgi:hypothetical protein